MAQSKVRSHFRQESHPAIADRSVLNNIIRRAHAHAMTMIHLANNRDNVQKGDPKIGGHPSACSSAMDILAALHLVVRKPQDYIAVKPHASPTDHSFHYLLRLFSEPNGDRMDDQRAQIAMKHLRHFSWEHEPVFQSYHSAFDPDHFGYLPSGSVGIPPVNCLYLAHAYQMAKTQGYDLPDDCHFWSLMGDSEYREGSLQEALPDAANRELHSLTWIVDYNRQSLDGDRILNEEALGGKDNDRIERTAVANGWECLQLRHGRFRKEVFAASPSGTALQNVIENALPDYEFQSLLVKKDGAAIRNAIGKYDGDAKKALSNLSEEQVYRFLTDLGGHDLEEITEALQFARMNKERPTMLIAHTIKGHRLKCAGQGSNHSALMDEGEVHELRRASGVSSQDLTEFARFEDGTPEAKYLAARGNWLWEGIQEIKALRARNIDSLKQKLDEFGSMAQFPKDAQINLKMTPWAHTQWMLGQITSKFSRISDTPLDGGSLKPKQKPLTDWEKLLKPVADLLVTMSPDVGTSTNIAYSMDGKIFGPESPDFESEYGVKDPTSPDVVPHEAPFSRHIRFDIEEGNTMSCVGSYGKMAEFIGVPFFPLMTVYDFFVKRALDQLFYNLYWKSSFILVGTPSGITLSPEGAQHCWKSDIQIPNLITWEPAFALELDWIVMDAFRRHIVSLIDGPDAKDGNKDRQGVFIRGVTRALEQREFLKRLKVHVRFQGQSDDAIFEHTRQDCLKGGYYVVDYRGMDDYRPGENVVHLFSMGALLPEALAASDQLKAQGICANVIQVSSPDLLVGVLAEQDDYRHLKHGLGVTGEIYICPEGVSAAERSYPPKYFAPTLASNGLGAGAQLLTLGARKIPIVSVHDGEVGLLDNIGSVVGTLQKALAVKKHSKSGRPVDVYRYHHMDADSIVEAAQSAMVEAALSKISIPASSARALGLDIQA